VSARWNAAPPFVLVLDDTRLLRSAKCWDVVAFVLRNLPPGAQLALGTRVDPPLPLPRMQASGDLVEFNGRQLALDRAEVAELARLHGFEADGAAIDALLAITEGWATGLHLACLAAGGRPLEEWLPRIRGERREIAAYLTSEVLDRQSAEVQDFLLMTSVLTELTPALCTLATGRRVAREELFVVALGDEGHRYRYHHFFSEMLEAELDARHPGQRVELHRRAAGWYAKRDDPDAGIMRRRTERLRGAVEHARLAEPLTPAERRVLELLPKYLTESQMAEQLFVSRNTAKTHLKSVYRKLEVSSRADAVQRARDTGLLSPE
jgi:LuxR family maltose regulon positive regulatory protein